MCGCIDPLSFVYHFVCTRYQDGCIAAGDDAHVYVIGGQPKECIDTGMNVVFFETIAEVKVTYAFGGGDPRVCIKTFGG